MRSGLLAKPNHGRLSNQPRPRTDRMITDSVEPWADLVRVSSEMEDVGVVLRHLTKPCGRIPAVCFCDREIIYGVSLWLTKPTLFPLDCVTLPPATCFLSTPPAEPEASQHTECVTQVCHIFKKTPVWLKTEVRGNKPVYTVIMA